MRQSWLQCSNTNCQRSNKTYLYKTLSNSNSQSSSSGSQW